jgi:hypothetical protein
VVECKVIAGREGLFSGQLHIFLDDNGLREIVLAVHGTVLGITEQKKLRGG